MIKQSKWFIIALVAVVVIAAAILFRGCDREPKVEKVTQLVIDTAENNRLRNVALTLFPTNWIS